ncbi:MAG: hypothetical protein E7294_14190 [Lachnospiraceae bacterium]|nr:hypothetical protein [Lachnospiraceae bacterium]
MANRGRDDLEKQGNAEVTALVAAALGAIAFGGKMYASNKEESRKKGKKEQLEREIQDLRLQKSNLSGGLLGLGSLFNSGEIDQIDAQIRKKQNELNQYK